ncbi:hypothetical protein [Micromonospora sp. NPDC003816]
MLLYDYDAYRRVGVGGIEQAERLAGRVPSALTAALRLVEDGSMLP